LLGVFYLTETRKLHTIYFDKRRQRIFDIDISDVKLTESLNIMRKMDVKNPDLKEKEKVTKQFDNISAIYKDTKNGRNWNTVERGTWYNQTLWMYMLKNTNSMPKNTEWKEDK